MAVKVSYIHSQPLLPSSQARAPLSPSSPLLSLTAQRPSLSSPPHQAGRVWHSFSLSPMACIAQQPSLSSSEQRVPSSSRSILEEAGSSSTPPFSLPERHGSGGSTHGEAGSGDDGSWEDRIWWWRGLGGRSGDGSLSTSPGLPRVMRIFWRRVRGG